VEAQAKSVLEASAEITVIRADGTIEKLGEVGYYHRNPWKRFAWKVRRMWRRS
jgi:hypothetical protein